MKKLLTLLFAAALTLSMTSFAQTSGDMGKAEKKEAKKEQKKEKKAAKKAAKKEKKEKKEEMKDKK